MYYDSELIYMESRTTDQERIDAIEAIITVMLETMAKAALKGMTNEYMLNDGQTIIKNIYRSPKELAAAIEALEILKGIYKRRLNNQSVRMVRAKNLFPKRWFGF